MKTERIMEEVMYFVAEDGTKFTSEDDCKKYEFKLCTLRKIKEAERLRIPNLNNVMPLGSDDSNNEFIWYKVMDVTELNLLKRAYPNSNIYIDSYPEVVCIECFWDADYPMRVMNTANVWYLSQIMDEIRDFCGNLGYRIQDEDRRKREPQQFRIRPITHDEFKLLRPNDIVWVKLNESRNTYARSQVVKYPGMEQISSQLTIETDLGIHYETEIYVSSIVDK